MKKLLALLSAVVLLAAVAVGVLTGKKNSLEADVKQLKTAVETLTKEKEELAPLKDTVEALENEKKTIEESVAALTAGKDEAEKELKTAKDNLRKKTTFLTRAQVSIAESKRLVENLKKTLTAKETEMADALKAAGGDAVKAEMEKLTAEKTELETKLKEALEKAKEADALKETVAALEKQLKEAQNRIAELEKDVEAALPAPVPVAEPAADKKAFTAEAEGFGGPVAVTVAFDTEGKITEMKIGDDRFAETEGFGAAALEPAFAEQFIGKKAPLKVEDVDALSGATITTQAVVDALNKAAQEAGF